MAQQKKSLRPTILCPLSVTQCFVSSVLDFGVARVLRPHNDLLSCLECLTTSLSSSAVAALVSSPASLSSPSSILHEPSQVEL